MHGKKEKTSITRFFIWISHLLAVVISFWIYSGDGYFIIGKWFDKRWISGDLFRHFVLMGFGLIYFFRLRWTLFIFLQRKVDWKEAIFVSLFLLIINIGFSLAGTGTRTSLGFLDILGIVLFLLGSYLNTSSEFQRYEWKRKPENKNNLYTSGLFSYARHINYFGDSVMLTGWAILTRNGFAFLIPIVITLGFIFFHIPMLTKYLLKKYPHQYKTWAGKTKAFIPFIY